jgi:glycosyltransferase involved in cell wall biosynthesis
MKISIITVCYNSGDWIKQSIESVLNQDYKNIEYIIVDGDSQDQTKEIIASYGDRITKFISEPDHGIYNAMNKGIKLAQGDYIYFLGSDDYLIDSQVISDVVNFIKQNPEFEFVYGNIEVRSSTQASYIHKPSKPEYALEELICGCLPHQASFAHSSLFDDSKVGLFSEHYKTASDYEWFVKMAVFQSEKEQKIGYYDRVIASYNADGISCNTNNMESVLTEMFDAQNTVELYQKNYWLKRRIQKYQQILINPNGYWGLHRKQNDKDQTNELKQQIETLQSEILR